MMIVTSSDATELIIYMQARVDLNQWYIQRGALHLFPSFMFTEKNQISKHFICEVVQEAF